MLSAGYYCRGFTTAAVFFTTHCESAEFSSSPGSTHDTQPVTAITGMK